MMTSRVFGTSALQSAFVLAFQIPNLFRKLFGEGALSSAFIPAFTESLEKEEKEASEKFARRMLTLLGLMLGVIVVAGIAALFTLEPFMPDSFRYKEAFPLIRIMLPYAPLICMTAVTMGVLNALHEFKAPAATTSLLNVVWITVLAALLVMHGLADETKIRVVSWAILLAGVLQFAYLWIVLRRMGWTIVPDLHFKDDARIRKVCLDTLPIAMSSAVTQVNLLVDNLFALRAATWGAASISYAERIIYLPLGVIATAYSTVLLPVFSRQYAQGDEDAMKRTLDSSIVGILVPIVPSAIGIAFLATPVTDVIYGGGAFSAESTSHVARALLCYSVGLPFFGLQKSLTQFFFGRHDKRTPVSISMFCVLVNFCLNLTFFLTLPTSWKHAGIALATTLSAMLSTVLLFAAMHRTTKVRPDYRAFTRTLLTTLASSVAMGFAARYVHACLVRPDAGYALRAGSLCAAVAAGGICYLALVVLLNRRAVALALRRGR
jgi:putative peptidoglycan lipid II flippase